MSISILCRHFCFSNASGLFHVNWRLQYHWNLVADRQTHSCACHVYFMSYLQVIRTWRVKKPRTRVILKGACFYLCTWIHAVKREVGTLSIVSTFNRKRLPIYTLTVTQCPWIIWEQINRWMIMYNRATSFQSLSSDSTHTLKIPLWAWCTSSFKSRYSPMHDYVSSFLVRRWVDVYLDWRVILWIMSTDVRFYITP